MGIDTIVICLTNQGADLAGLTEKQKGSPKRGLPLHARVEERLCYGVTKTDLFVVDAGVSWMMDWAFSTSARSTSSGVAFGCAAR